MSIMPQRAVPKHNNVNKIVQENKLPSKMLGSSNRFKLSPLTFAKQPQLKQTPNYTQNNNSNHINDDSSEGNNDSMKPQLLKNAKTNVKGQKSNISNFNNAKNQQFCEPQSRMQQSVNQLIHNNNKNQLIQSKNITSTENIRSSIKKQSKSNNNNVRFSSVESIKIQNDGTQNRIILGNPNQQQKEKDFIPTISQHELNHMNEQQAKKTLKEYMAIAKQKTQKLLQSIPFQIIITILTICSLFMEDMRTLFVDRKDDHIIDYVNLLFLSVFFIQIIMSLTVENYAFSFFFYLDLVSTFSICMDVTMFTDLIYNSGGNVQQINMLIAQSKASRAAARAVRVMKIFRLARVVKLYKSAIKTRELNQLKQKQLLKQKMKQKRKVNVSSGFINDNYEASQYKLAFTNQSLSHHQFPSGSENQNLSQSNKKFSQMNELSGNRKEGNILDFVDRIHEQSQGQQQGSEHQKVKSNLINTNIINVNLQNLSQRRQKQKQQSVQQEQEEEQLDYGSGDKSNKNLESLSTHQQQSKISKILSESTIKKIIIVILVIMFSSTALDVNNYAPDNTSWDMLTKLVAKLLLQQNVSLQYINNLIQTNLDYISTLQLKSSLVAVETPFNQLYSLQVVDYSQLRITEIGLSEAEIDIDAIFKIRPNLTLNMELAQSSTSASTYNAVSIIVSYQSYNQVDSLFSIAKIIFICLTILYLLQSFNSNIELLIVSPIQKMLDVVVHPQKKLQEDKDQNQDFKQARYQTLIVQKAILKIRTLMSTIYGKIGMDLLYNQLFKTQSINAKNYISIKKKSYCIYGICRVKNWVEISQTLENDSFTFINQIANIVHGAVFRYGGYGVKNLSDGFLVVFKLPQGKQREITEQALKYKFTKQKQNTYLNIFCDFSVYSFIKTIVRIHKQPKLLKYKKDQRILYQFGNNFQVEMSFSLGIGQSIQGMVGSQFKIDPIYLGSKLNEVWKMSSISSKYPNTIIIEKELYENLTGGLKNYCRIMQYVSLSHYDDGNTQVYAIDLDLQYISPSKNRAERKKNEQYLDINLKRQLNLQHLKNPTEISNYSASAFITSKKELREVLKKKISDDMKKKYQTAFDSYIQGDWKEAKSKFEDIMRIIKEDPLCRRIYNFMAERNFKHTQAVPLYKNVSDL